MSQTNTPFPTLVIIDVTTKYLRLTRWYLVSTPVLAFGVYALLDPHRAFNATPSSLFVLGLYGLLVNWLGIYTRDRDLRSSIKSSLWRQDFIRVSINRKATYFEACKWDRSELEPNLQRISGTLERLEPSKVNDRRQTFLVKTYT